MASTVPGFEHDVFVSYPHADDFAWTDGFISLLATELGEALGSGGARQLFVDRASLAIGADWSQEIEDALRSSVTLLPLISPNYLKSPECSRELKIFEEAGYADPKFRRLFPIVRRPGVGDTFETFRPDVQRHKFFDQITRAPLSVGSEDFTNGVVILARDLATALVQRRNSFRKVFLAPTAYGADPCRQRFNAELTKRCFQVLPEAPAFVSLDIAVQDIDKSSHTIHILGDDWDQRSLDLLRTAAELKKTLLVFIAINPGRVDAKQMELIDAVRRQEIPGASTKQPDVHILSTSEREALREVVACLSPRSNENEGQPKCVYLMCSEDTEEVASAHTLAGMIKDRTMLPVFTSADGGSESRFERHQRMMARADGLVAYCDRGERSWLDQKIRDLRNLPRFMRVKEAPPSALVLGPRFADLLSSDILVIQASAPIQSTAIDHFTQTLTSS